MQEEQECEQGESKNELGYVMMPLLNTAFVPGHCMEEVQRITDEKQREIALGEYYYFSGQPEEAARVMEPHLTEENTALRLSANFVYAFSNLANDRIACVRRAGSDLKERMAGGF